MSADQLVGWTMFALALGVLIGVRVGMVAQEWHSKRGGCDCTELCGMGPTCPGGALAGLPGSGCWRVPKRRLHGWLTYHSLAAHIVAPLWIRVPEKWRWKIVHRLDRSQERCWSDLVGAALTHPEKDACDIRTPLGCDAGPCKSRCDWSHPSHTGEHDCSCYCGKFQQRANDGAIDRSAR